MRLRNLLLLGVAVSALALPAAAQVTPDPSAAPVATMSAKAAASGYGFWQSIGVNFHAEYDAAAGLAANPYNDLNKVIAAIKYLGIKEIRASPGGDGFSRMQQVADATGAKFSFFFTTGWGQTYASQVALAKSVLSSSDNWIAMIEDANEPDNFHLQFGGLTGMTAAAAQQQAVWSALGNSGVPIASTSVGNPNDIAQLGNLTGTATYSNAHTYPPAGATASDWLASWLPKSQSASPFFVQTEAGYSTNAPDQGSFNGSVTEHAAARMLLNLLVASYKAGVAATFIYELVDSDPNGGNCDPTGTNRELHFGLFRCDWSAKPSALSVANMVSVVRDAKPTQQFANALNFSVTGISSYKTLLLSRSDGGYIVVVWSEPVITDGMHDIPAPTMHGTVAFGETAKAVAVYDPLVGVTDAGADASVTSGGPPTLAPIATASNVASIGIDVSDHPVLVLINGTTGAGASALFTAANLAAPLPKQDSGTGQAPAVPPAAGGETFTAPDGSTVFIPPGGSLQDAVLTLANGSQPAPTTPPAPAAPGTDIATPSGPTTPIAVTPTPTPVPTTPANPSGMGADIVSVAAKYYGSGGPITSGPTVTVSAGQSLAAAVANAAPGSTILVGPGTYAGGITATANGITIISTVPGGAKITDQGASAWDSSAVYLKGDGQKLVGFDISGAGPSSWSAPVINTGSNDVIAMNVIHDVLATPAQLANDGGHGGGAIVNAGDYGGGNVLVEGNTISTVVPPGQKSSLVHAVYTTMGGAVVNNIIGTNSGDIGGLGVQVHSPSAGVTVENNTITDALDGGVLLWDTSNSTVKSNAVTGSPTVFSTWGGAGTGNTVTGNGQ